MNTEQELYERSQPRCEMCGTTDNLGVYEVPPDSDNSADQSVLICATSREQIEEPVKTDVHHWRCLNDSMWSQVPAVQVMTWAQAAGDGSSNTESTIQHLDSSGTLLEAGDTVTLIKDLNVKGANFTAKRGTAVGRISLAADNPEQIEGGINGQRIVILTKFVKKTS